MPSYRLNARLNIQLKQQVQTKINTTGVHQQRSAYVVSHASLFWGDDMESRRLHSAGRLDYFSHVVTNRNGVFCVTRFKTAIR